MGPREPVPGNTADSRRPRPSKEVQISAKSPHAHTQSLTQPGKSSHNLERVIPMAAPFHDGEFVR
jgi:hypothetical protein